MYWPVLVLRYKELEHEVSLGRRGICTTAIVYLIHKLPLRCYKKRTLSLCKHDLVLKSIHVSLAHQIGDTGLK